MNVVVGGHPKIITLQVICLYIDYNDYVVHNLYVVCSAQKSHGDFKMLEGNSRSIGLPGPGFESVSSAFRATVF